MAQHPACLIRKQEGGDRAGLELEQSPTFYELSITPPPLLRSHRAQCDAVVTYLFLWRRGLGYSSFYT